MNKWDLAGLPKYISDLSEISGFLNDRRTIALSPNCSFQINSKYELKDFFDIVISFGTKNINISPNPDIVVCGIDDVFRGSITDLEANIFRMKDTLIIIDQALDEFLQKKNARPNNFMLKTANPVDFQYIRNNMKLADAWICSTDGTIENLNGLKTTIDEYMNTLDKYKNPVYLKTRNRNLLMNIWG